MSESLNGNIMSADRPVAEIRDDIIVSVNKQLAPLSFKVGASVVPWLVNRAIDAHRTNSRLLKRVLRLSNKDDLSTVLYVNAATVTDNYWYRCNGDTITWDDVRFKYNYLDQLALRGDPNCFSQEPGRTPELTNIGSFEKCWRRIDDAWWIYKSGKDLELFSELFCARLGEKMGIRMAYYELSDQYVRSRDFTENNKYNLEGADALVGEDEDYFLNFRVFSGLGEQFAEDYIKMIYLDGICFNMDRHTTNYGVLRDAITGDIVCMAPCYDFNIALISRGYPLYPEVSDLLIKGFIELVNCDPAARSVFDKVSIPVLREQDVIDIIQSIDIPVDTDKVKDLVMIRQELLLQGIEKDRSARTIDKSEPEH